MGELYTNIKKKFIEITRIKTATEQQEFKNQKCLLVKIWYSLKHTVIYIGYERSQLGYMIKNLDKSLDMVFKIFCQPFLTANNIQKKAVKNLQWPNFTTPRLAARVSNMNHHLPNWKSWFFVS